MKRGNQQDQALQEFLLRRSDHRQAQAVGLEQLAFAVLNFRQGKEETSWGNLFEAMIDGDEASELCEQISAIAAHQTWLPFDFANLFSRLMILGASEPWSQWQ